MSGKAGLAWSVVRDGESDTDTARGRAVGRLVKMGCRPEFCSVLPKEDALRIIRELRDIEALGKVAKMVRVLPDDARVAVAVGTRE